MLWYHQEVPHSILATTTARNKFDTNGQTVEAVAEAGKDGYLYTLNAARKRQLRL